MEIEKLSLEEKIGQLFMIGIEEKNIEKIVGLIYNAQYMSWYLECN